MAEFAEYPKYLVKGEESRIVADEREEQAAISAGFEFQGSEAKPAAKPSEPTPEPVKFIEYPKMLVRGEDCRVVEDDDGEALARHEGFHFAGESAKALETGNADNSAAIKAELDDLGVEYDRRIKDPAKLAKILADAKAATDPEA